MLGLYASTVLLMATALFLQHQQHRLMSLNRLCVLFLFPIKFRYRCMQGFAESLPTQAHITIACTLTSYYLHSSHRFLPTWGVVMLEKKKKKKKN